MKVKATIILLITIALITANTIPASSVSGLKFNGRGWGHGLGMSQYGAKGFAQHGYNSSQILARFYKNSQSAKASNSTLKVHIAGGKRTVTLTSSAPFYVYDLYTKIKYSLAGKAKYQVQNYSNRYRLYNLSTKKIKGIYKGPLHFKPGKSPIQFCNINDNGYSNVKYRNNIRVVIKFVKFMVVNHVYLESYLKGVVPYEMPSSWPMEALKAQAIAARSYALSCKRNLGGFNLYSTTASQVYGGVNAENRRTNKACNSTKSIIRAYKGKVIQAFFFSSSGGKTENNENVWGGSPISYLRGTTSPYESANGWSRSFSASYVKSKLGNYSSSNTSGVKGSLLSLTVTKTGYSPRVIQVRIKGTAGSSYIGGNRLRQKLGLRSTWFSIKSY